MSGVLRSLVRRATGQATTGLRPRLPSRFETMGEPGFVETHTETSAAPPAPGPQQPIAGESPQTTAPPQVLPLPTPPPALMPRKQEPSRVSVVPPSPTVEAEQAMPPPEPPKPEPAPFAPLLTEMEVAETEPLAPIPPVRPTRQPLPESPPPPDAPTATTQAPPEPLLPPAPTQDLPDGLAKIAAHDNPTAPAREPQPPEPEITIHIGRLDVRSPQPQTPGQPARAPARPLPSLSDYLRGGRS